MRGVGAVLGSQPSLQLQFPPLSIASESQTNPLISKSRCKSMFLLVSKKLYVTVGGGVFTYGGGQKCVLGS